MPIRKAEPIVDLQKKTIFIWGSPKIGKTTFATSCPGAVVLATEPGLNDMTCERWEYDESHYVINSWVDLGQATTDVIAAGYKTIVLDTADNAYTLCEKYVCNQHKVEHKQAGVLGYGVGDALITAKFRGYITWLASAGMGLIMTSHATTETVGETTIVVPTLNKKIRPIVMGSMDIILYCTTEVNVGADGKRKNNHVIWCKPDASYEAGDRTGRFPEKMPLNYEAFAAAYAAGAPRP